MTMNAWPKFKLLNIYSPMQWQYIAWSNYTKVIKNVYTTLHCYYDECHKALYILLRVQVSGI